MGNHKLLFSKVEAWVAAHPDGKVFTARDGARALNLTTSSVGNLLKGSDAVEKCGNGWRKVSVAEAEA